MKPIYLDNNSTTPVDPGVLKAMVAYCRDNFGNAASRNHSLGGEATDAVRARHGLFAGQGSAGGGGAGGRQLVGKENAGGLGR